MFISSKDLALHHFTHTTSSETIAKKTTLDNCNLCLISHKNASLQKFC